MKVVLLERVAHLGKMGDLVDVRPGYARNYLIPQGKALRATPSNLEKFEEQRATLEAKNLKLQEEALSLAEKLALQTLTTIRAASETGQLYGSVSSRDVALMLEEQGFKLQRTQVYIAQPIKTLGIHTVVLQLHGDVAVDILVNIARTADEAERQLAEHKKTNEAAAVEPVDKDEATAETSESNEDTE